MFVYDHGIRLLDSALTFDARRRSKLCCVSHGHSDHIRAHDLSYATPATLAFMQARLGRTRHQAMPFRQPMMVEGYQISFHPAGHILGSAQILAEREGERLLYTGDFKLEPGATAEPLEMQQCDTLIMECTFGHPRFRFPPRTELEERLCTWAAHSLQEGKTPVIYAYALGKSQEAMKILSENGFALVVHGTVARLAQIYEEFGCRLGAFEPLRRTTQLEGKVVIAPTQARHNRFFARLAGRSTMYLSGWAADPGFRFRQGVDEALPLSDHADFPGLLDFVRAVQPRRIFTTHGPESFALHLRNHGYDARPLEPPRQKELF